MKIVLRTGPSLVPSEYIKDIYFFEINTKYISSSVLTRPRENSNVFTEKINFLFILYFYRLHAMSHTLLKMLKRKFLANPN